jgi:hypothetical protein
LVGHDKNQEAGLVEQPDRLARAIDPAEVLDRPDIALVVIEDAVAVEKGGWAARLARTGRDGAITSRARRPA